MPDALPTYLCWPRRDRDGEGRLTVAGVGCYLLSRAEVHLPKMAIPRRCLWWSYIYLNLDVDRLLIP
jgi:hypothetical protein